MAKKMKKNITLFQVIPAILAISVCVIVATLWYSHRSQPNRNSPQVSKSELYFVRGFNLWEMKDGHENQLTSNASDFTTSYNQPKLSPNGGAVAFVQNQKDGKYSLFVTRTTVFQPKLIAEDLSIPATFAWAGNANSIYYISSSNERSSFDNQTYEVTRDVKLIAVDTLAKENVGSLSIIGECGGGTSDPSQILSMEEGTENTGNGMNTFEVDSQSTVLLHTTDCVGENLALFDLKQKKDTVILKDSMRGLISPDGLHVIVVRGKKIVLISTKTGLEEKNFDTEGTPITLLWNVDGQHVFYSSFEKKSDVMYETQTSQKDYKSQYSIHSSTIYSIDMKSGLVEKEMERTAYAIRLMNTRALYSQLIFSEIENTSESMDPKVNVNSLDLVSKKISTILTDAHQATSN